MADNCNILTGGIQLDCEAIKKAGGAYKEVWMGSQSSIQAKTIDPSTKELKTLVLKSGHYLSKIESQKENISATATPAPSETGVMFYNTTVTVPTFIISQANREFLKSVDSFDDLFFLVRLNSGKIDSYGLIGLDGNPGMGLKRTGGDLTFGKLITDTRRTELVFTGLQDNLPVFASFGVDLNADITYLDALLQPEEPA